jgi:hypothetical protein
MIREPPATVLRQVHQYGLQTDEEAIRGDQDDGKEALFVADFVFVFLLMFAAAVHCHHHRVVEGMVSGIDVVVVVHHRIVGRERGHSLSAVFFCVRARALCFTKDLIRASACRADWIK